MKKLLTILLSAGFFLSGPAQTETYFLKDLQSGYSLTEALSFVEDSGGESSTASFLNGAQDANFRPYAHWKDKFESNSHYWGKIRLENQLPDAEYYSEWVLEASTSLSEIIAYAVYPDGHYKTSHSGIFYPYYQKDFRPAADPNLIKVILPPRTPVTIYFRAGSQRSTIVPDFTMKLKHASQFYQTRSQKKWINGIFLGFVLMMLIYNLVLLLYFRDPAYVYYSLYLLAIGIYSAYATGDLGDWLTPYLFYEHPQYLFLVKFVIYGGLIAYLSFMRFFFDLRNLMPLWDRIFKWLIIIGVPAMILDIALLVGFNFSYLYSDQVSIWYSAAFVLLSLAFLLALFKAPSDKKKFFIIFGIAAMCIGFFLTIIERIQWHSFTLIPFRIGTTLEILAFSLGLAYRQRQNEREKQRALFKQEQEHAETMRLKKLDEMRTRFYNNITHEFRTPLTVIQGMAENMTENEQARQLILRNSRDLLRLINQMLDLAKLESGKLELNLIQGDIIDLIQYLTESFRPLANSKNVRLNFYSEEEKLLMDYDETKIQQIVYNLLSNAVKFTPPGGKVTVHLQANETSSSLRIKVKDTGIGIAEEHRERIFDHFFQAPEQPSGKMETAGSAAQGAAGTGIGLSLTKELVNLMKGSIHLKSEVGTGAEFILTLPIRRTAEKTESSGHSRELFVEPAPSLSFPKENTKTTAPDGAPLLLIIEDNHDIITYLESCLQEEYRIIVAIDGTQGADSAYESIPDIIISDVMMPGKDGLELCRELKSDERTSHIPIILLTARSGEEAMLEGLQKGADAYLTKPFRKEELLLRLENLIELSKRNQALFSTRIVHTGADPVEEKQPGPDEIFLQKLREVVEERINEPELSIPYLCKAVQLSHTQIYRKLKALTGQTPSQFIRSVRLAKAKDLLETTDLNISEIAYDVGFTDPNYFSRMFQETYGLPPSAIRK